MEGMFSLEMPAGTIARWRPDGSSVIQGRATLTVGIHILFFSMSVQISMEKSFGNQAGDPRIADVITLQDWQSYAAAFA